MQGEHMLNPFQDQVVDLHTPLCRDDLQPLQLIRVYPQRRRPLAIDGLSLRRVRGGLLRHH